MAAEGLLLRVVVPGTTSRMTVVKRQGVNAAATMPRRRLRLRRHGRMRGGSGRHPLGASLTREGGGGRAQIDRHPHRRIGRDTTVTAFLRGVGTAGRLLIGSNNTPNSSSSNNIRNSSSSNNSSYNGSIDINSGSNCTSNN
jgi:hypothetical protein